MKTTFYLRAIRREARGNRGRLMFFVTCLTVGVAAVVGVASLTAAFEQALRDQSRELLGADIVVSSRRPLPAELDGFFAELPGGFERTDVTELPTMASTKRTSTKSTSTKSSSAQMQNGARKNRLVQLEAVRGVYPLRGDLRLSGNQSLGETLSPDSVVVAPELLDELEIEIGDSLRLGTASFRIAAVVVEATDRLDFSFALAPRIFILRDVLDSTGLVTFGSRLRYRALYRLADDFSPADLTHLRTRLRKELPGADYVSVETHEQAQPSIRRGLRRVERFLGLTALLSLLMGGLGVAQVIRTWLAGRTRAIAIYRCLGMRPREVLVLFLSLVIVVAFAGALLGCIVGSAAPFVVNLIAPDTLGTLRLAWWQPWAVFRGLTLGVGVAIIFSLPPLITVWKVSPAMVLRSTVSPLPVRWTIQGAAGLALFASVFGSAWVQAGRLDLAFGFTLTLVATSIALVFGAWGTMAVVARLPRSGLGPYLRTGLAALARPGAGTIGATVALGLGMLVVITIYLVESRLARQLDRELPTDAPSVYLWDVQPDQDDGIRQLLKEEGATSINSVPVVMARLAAVDGTPVKKVIEERGRRWVLTRQQRITSMAELPESNRLLDGALWSDPSSAEVSLEQGFAEDLGARVGTQLRFDVQGIPVDLRVTSIREVEWQSFDINFFVVAEPGVLDGAPQFRMVGVRLPEDSELKVQDRLATDFSNVTVFRVRSILQKVMEIIQRLALAVRLLGGVTIVVGLIILAGTISATTLRRARETALLRTLGLTRRGVASLLAVEYALLGTLAGVLGAFGAYGLSYAFFRGVLDLRPELPYTLLPIVVVLSAALVAVCGLVASTRALRAEPVRLLRE